MYIITIHLENKNKMTNSKETREKWHIAHSGTWLSIQKVQRPEVVRKYS